MSIRFSGYEGVELAGDLAGRWGDPLVVLLHGGGQTRFSWGATAAALVESGFLALSLDLRGHGESDWSPTGSYQIDTYADDLRRVVAAMGRPAALVGASLGGLTSTLAAGESPEVDCSAVVLVDVTPRMDQGGAQAITSFMLAHPEGFESVDAAADAVAEYLPNRPRPRDVSGLRKNLRQDDSGRYYWHWDPRMLDGERNDPRAINPERFEAALVNITAPILLVRGVLSELVSEEGAAAFRAVVPDAEYVDVPDAAHMVAGDRNDVFSDAVISFLDRHRAAK